MAKDDNVSATVAENRSVELDGQVYGPGKKIVLSMADAASLRAHGYLVDDGAAAVSESAKPGAAGKSSKKAAARASDSGGAEPGVLISESGAGDSTSEPGSTGGPDDEPS
jgi:hypothetical protein